MLNQNNTLLIPGKAGQIEAIMDLPENANSDTIAIICHPHPLFEGTMHNKVVSTLHRACNQRNIPNMRFNFRGVGKSEGEYAGAEGGVEDCRSVINYLQNNYPHKNLWIFGFSFGAYVAAKTATQVATELLITVAPPVGKDYFGQLPERKQPWILVQAKDDKVIDAQAVYDWYDNLECQPQLISFDEAGHFFHGKLIPLREKLLEAINSFSALEVNQS